MSLYFSLNNSTLHAYTSNVVVIIYHVVVDSKFLLHFAAVVHQMLSSSVVLLKYLNEYIWFYAICICKARMRVIFLASSHSFNSFPSTNLFVGKKKNRTQFTHLMKKMRMHAVLTFNFINIARMQKCVELKVCRLYKFAWEYVSLRPTTDDARGKNGIKLNRVARRKQKKIAFAQCATKVFVCYVFGARHILVYVCDDGSVAYRIELIMARSCKLYINARSVCGGGGSIVGARLLVINCKRALCELARLLKIFINYICDLYGACFFFFLAIWTPIILHFARSCHSKNVCFSLIAPRITRN